MNKIELNAEERNKLYKKAFKLRTKSSFNTITQTKATFRESPFMNDRKINIGLTDRSKETFLTSNNKLPEISHGSKRLKSIRLSSDSFKEREESKKEDHIKFANGGEVVPVTVAKTRTHWQKEKIEGMNVTYYSKRTINEKRLQYKLLLDKFYIISEKGFKLKVILDRGIKVILCMMSRLRHKMW